MSLFEIIETDAGLTVAELEPGMSPEVAAEKLGGVLVDPGPYPDYEEAIDAVIALQSYEEEDYDLT
ncbi:MAG TPA: hypothetical protein VE890_16795 [Thermoguttaceae bacterium]|nr:hypothetical protein [Thermoguttaceae bacterium]